MSRFIQGVSIWGSWQRMAASAALGLAGLWGVPSSQLSSCQAQWVTYYRPATVYYAPAPVAVAAPTTYVAASPVVVGPVVRAPIVVARPTPVVAYYGAPAYVPAPTVSYVPTAQVWTRYRPILGGSVSRVRYGYAPIAIP